MKKILVCGATHGSNFGDSLFAYMFNRNIESKHKDIEVVFTRASEYSKKELGIKAASFKDLLTVDALIYISGGYFGESHHETLKGSIYRFLLYFIYGLLMILRKKPIAILGVGAGPLKRKFLRKSAVYIFNNSKLVSVRDENSKEYMKSYGVIKNIIVTSDSAQVIDNEMFGIGNIENPKMNIDKIKSLKKVLVHITDAEGKELYYKHVIKAIQESLCTNENYGFIITSDAIIKDEYLVDIYNEFPKDRTIIYDYQNPLEFLSVISLAEAIITPKLHVGILGSTYGKPVLSFPIHPGKTERYFKQIDFKEHCKSLYEMNKEEVKNMISKYLWEEVKLPDEIKKNANRNFLMLNDFIDEYIVKIK